MLYQNCRQLPIHIFNEINISGDLTLLIENKKNITELNIKEKYPEEILQEQWGKIIAEFEKISKNKKTAFLYKLKSEVLHLQYKVNYYSLILDFSEEGQDIEEIIKPIKLKDVKGFLASARNNLNSRIKQLEKEVGADEQEDFQDFEKALAIAKGNGYIIDRFTLPVSEWVEIINQLEQRAKEFEKSKNKQGKFR